MFRKRFVVFGFVGAHGCVPSPRNIICMSIAREYFGNNILFMETNNRKSEEGDSAAKHRKV